VELVAEVADRVIADVCTASCKGVGTRFFPHR
jgi:hypothetical protein